MLGSSCSFISYSKPLGNKILIINLDLQVDLVLEVEKCIPCILRKRFKLFRIKPKEIVCDSQQKSLLSRIKPHPASMSAVQNAMRNSKVHISVNPLCKFCCHVMLSSQQLLHIFNDICYFINLFVLHTQGNQISSYKGIYTSNMSSIIRENISYTLYL